MAALQFLTPCHLSGCHLPQEGLQASALITSLCCQTLHLHQGLFVLFLQGQSISSFETLMNTLGDISSHTGILMKEICRTLIELTTGWEPIIFSYENV